MGGAPALSQLQKSKSDTGRESCTVQGHVMKIPRRKFLHLAAGTAALPAVSRVARAQAYPSRPVRIVVGFAAGGPIDIVARLIGQWLSERLEQHFIVENRLGAATNIATEAVVHAPPEGHTLLMVTQSNAINATLYEKLNYNFVRDIAPVAAIAREPVVMVVNSLFPPKTLRDFIAYAKANPGKINIASAGIGSGSHMAGELLEMMTGVNLLHVPYRGNAPAMTDLLGGQVQVLFNAISTAIDHIRAGKLRALAVTTKARLESLPDIPTVDEFVAGYEFFIWYGIGVPRNTPTNIIDKLNKEINAAFLDPKMKAQLADFSRELLPGSPTDFGKLIADETVKWGRVIRAANIKVD
jgi:tripartite-type tricarboxylate transporter receptor subunit TctC